MKYAYENGCKLHKQQITVCSLACEFGQLECLKYLHNIGCNWNMRVGELAVKNRHFDCFKYAHENGCPMSKKIVYIAVGNGDYGIMKYAIDNDYYYDKNKILRHIKPKNIEVKDCLQYIKNKCV